MNVRLMYSMGLGLVLMASNVLGQVESSSAPPVTVRTLLREMIDPSAVALYPEHTYRCLQASSYNRASSNRKQSDQTVNGWFADSDGLGFIRTEQRNDKTEWVIMEHAGPGCITRIWTPYFYYDLNERVGPNVRIYLDGAEEPVIDESLIRLVRGEGAFRPPLAISTARAGDSYFPIPYAKSCKVTLTGKAFYNVINYRAYPPGTLVETFSRSVIQEAESEVEEASRGLMRSSEEAKPTVVHASSILAGDILNIELPEGPGALRQLTVRIPAAVTNTNLLRTTILVLTFDGEETVWCPLGDFFCSPDSVHPSDTWQRSVRGDGTFVSRWVMPYRRSGLLQLVNLGADSISLKAETRVTPWQWNSSSMHFHANWRPDDVVPGTPFQDWNFIDIRGKGIYVGDAWTVLNIQGSWWGEGDEKIYIDEAWDLGFPTHFGTGTEDYYGWAGGVVPTRRDEFSVPFLANVRVGGLDGQTTGFNICTRTRSLDAIPFTNRLVFDMESSFGTDIRNPWNLLGYSAVTFWYARPGATHNRPPNPAAAVRGVLKLEELKARAAEIQRGKSG